MIVDFQHHWTPRELFKEELGDRRILAYDETGAPSYTSHRLLYDLDEHIAMMDLAGIDAAFLTSGAGMGADLERSRFINDKAKEAERNYPGRIIGAAHVHPLGGAAHLKELARCADALGFPGVCITSESDGKFIDDAAYEPFWHEAETRGLFVFIHPALKLNFPQPFDSYDTARAVGREFSLIMATIRIVNSGLLDRHPNLLIHMAHLSGGIASMLARVRGFQDKEFWGTQGNAKHGALPQHEFDHYLRERIIFDTAGFCGGIGAVKSALLEIPAARIVFASDYPQEMRTREQVRDFVAAIRALGPAGQQILGGNTEKLLKGRARQTAVA